MGCLFEKCMCHYSVCKMNYYMQCCGSAYQLFLSVYMMIFFILSYWIEFKNYAALLQCFQNE
jgi:hypothetical protein